MIFEMGVILVCKRGQEEERQQPNWEWRAHTTINMTGTRRVSNIGKPFCQRKNVARHGKVQGVEKTDRTQWKKLIPRGHKLEALIGNDNKNQPSRQIGIHIGI